MSISKISRTLRYGLYSLVLAILTAADWGHTLGKAIYKGIKRTGSWLAEIVTSHLPAVAKAATNASHETPMQRLRSSAEYQRRQIKRDTPRVTDSWRMCPSM